MTKGLEGKAVVVTGAGSGIGRATAIAAARRGAKVYVCDVSPEGMAETARLAAAGGGGRILGMERVDVAQADAVASFAEVVHADVGAVDLLVNNAGVPLGAHFLDTSLDDWRWIIDINLMGVVHGCRSFAPAMVARGKGGQITNVASMAAFFPAAATSAYCATKAAVAMLSECLRVELAPKGVSVSAICPGVIDTPIVHAGRFRGPVGERAARARIAAAFAKRSYPAERVADAILGTISGGPAIVPVAPEAWAFYLAKRAVPGLTLRLSGWVGRRLERELEAGELRP